MTNTTNYFTHTRKSSQKGLEEKVLLYVTWEMSSVYNIKNKRNYIGPVLHLNVKVVVCRGYGMWLNTSHPALLMYWN